MKDQGLFKVIKKYFGPICNEKNLGKNISKGKNEKNLRNTQFIAKQFRVIINSGFHPLTTMRYWTNSATCNWANSAALFHYM